MPHTLLLADDSVTIQRVIELTFADEDVRVVAVSDGEQAIARIEADPPDIVLADIGMPGRNGYEVARYIKQSPRLSHIPVVLLTGAFEPVDQARAREAGCDGVLAKPFEPQLVIERVHELLTSPRQSRSAPLPADNGDRDRSAAPAAASRGGDLGEYFDRLDAAFANLSSSPPVPASDVDETPPPQSAALAVPAAAKTATLPSLGDAFAALLAAEQQETGPPGAATWPAHALMPNISDELVEAIVNRVLDRLSERVTRQRVSEIVSSVAERLVREEIERIKGSIK